MSYPGLMRNDGLGDPPDLEIPARYLLALVCAEGGADCPLFADRSEAEVLLASVWNHPAATIRLVSDADGIPHFPEVRRSDGFDRIDRPALLDRKRDLAVLQRLGLVPGDTRRARYLFELLLSRIPTPRGICSGVTPGWEGCPLADSLAYEEVRRAGATRILGERSEAERLAGRRASAERIANDPEIHVRPHHLMCMSCWVGDGSDLRPRENDTLDLLWERIRRDPEVEIVLVEANCEACFCCDGFDPGSTRCVHAGGLIRDYKKDIDVFEAIGLFPGDRMKARELLSLIFDRIPSTTAICGYGNGVTTSSEWSVCSGPDGNRGYEAAREVIPEMIQRQIRPKTTVPCADLPELLRFADGNPVRTGAQWARRREEIRRLMCETFVGFPPEVAPRIVDAEVIEVVSESGGGERRRVRLTFDTTNRASFEVLVRVPSGTGRFPIFLTVPYGFWPDIAVDRGYLTCVYPGADGDDSSDLFAAAYPDCSWSLLFRRAWLGSRALDYLVTLPEADPAKVCMTGHSRNGKQSLIAAAFDERITSVAASSPGSPGAAPYRFTSHDTFNEAPDAFVNHWFLESLRDYTGREHELPIDSHGWYALIAPRPCLIGTAWNDGCEPTFAVERGYLAGSDVYRFLGAPESLRVKWRPGGHHRTKELDAKMVGEYFDWFDLSFGRGGTKRSDFPEEFIHRFDFAAWRSRLTPAELETPSADADRLTRVRWVLGTPPRSVRVDDYRGEQARGTREALAIPERDVAGGISGFYSAEESKLFDHDRWAPDSVVRVPVVFGEGVRGNVYCRRDARGPLPAVVWLHPASYATGYNEAYGPASWLSSPSTTQPRGVEITTIYHRLAAAGHLVLAFDQCGFGSRLIEGRDFYDEYPKWSRLGRMVHDVGRALDFLESGDWNSASPLPPVDRRRISAVGYALGGMVALFAAALDRRISAAASVAGFTPLRSDTDAKSTGGIRRFWEWHAFAPLLGLYAGRESELPFDFEDLFALIAPRPALVVAPRRDRFADHAEVAACLAASKRWWDEVGAGDALDFVEPDDINRLQKAQQDLVVEWLARLG